MIALPRPNNSTTLTTVVVLGLIFGLQIVMVGPLAVGMSTTPFSIAFRSLLLLIAAYLASKVLLFPKRIVWSSGMVWLLIFFALYALRFVFDLYVLDIETSSRLGGRGKLTQFLFGSSIIPILGVSTVTLSAKAIEKTIFYMSLLQCLAICYIFFVLYGVTTEAFVSRYYVATIFRDSDIGQPINPIIISRAGGILAVCSLFVGGIRKWVRIMTLALGVMLLMLGSSRGPLFAFIVCLVFALYKFLIKGSFEIIVLKLIATILLAALLFVFVSSIFDSLNLGIVNRIVETADSSGKGEDRLKTWSAAWQQFKYSPLIGDKIVEDYTLTYPHNLFLEVLMSLGMIGFIPFVIAIWKAISRSFKLYRDRIRVTPMLFLFLLMSIMFSGSIVLSSEFWLSMVLIYNLRDNQ